MTCLAFRESFICKNTHFLPTCKIFLPQRFPTIWYRLDLSCHAFSSCSLCQPCCVLIVCKKGAKRCGFCYHFGPCKCAYVRKPMLDDIDTSDESNTPRPFVCICCEKENPDDELGIPCGDSDTKRDTQRTKSEKDPLIAPKSETTTA